jgi:succinoglycan biosynthesis transport protein ExoP
LSAFIVNNIFKEFLRYYSNIRSVKSQESIDTLQSIMDKKKQEWDEKNKLLKGEGLVDVATENESKLDLISDYQKSLTEEKNKKTDDSFALRRINQKLTGMSSATNGLASTNSAAENEELIIARKATNEAYAEYLKTNDKDKLARYNQLKAEYDKKYANSSSPEVVNSPDKRNDLLDKKSDMEAAIESSNQKIRSLEQNIITLRAGVSSISSKGANVETILEEAKLAEKDYFEAKQKYGNALDVTASSVNNFRQIQIAQPAIEPEPSKRKIVVGMAGALTFLSSILIIIFLTYLDSSLRTPGIFSRTVNLKLISIINFMNLKNKVLKDIVTGQVKNLDQIEKKRNNVFRESIRKLRYEIENSGKRIFLFTSTQKGQGKTTLIQAVSYSLSMSRKKILIVDTNFSNNDLTRDLRAEPILEKISDDNNTMSMTDKIKFFSKIISVEAGGGEICVIGSEGGDYTPSEILPRENLLTNLHVLLPEFDYIFLEGPPLNDFSDSKELIHYVDGVIAVFSAKHIIKQIDKESIAFFSQLNGKFSGSVLNMIDLENVNAI